ncbi:MAG: NAD(P)/FAD-dependent oxidoreductase [Woeseiaceae bacterium]
MKIAVIGTGIAGNVAAYKLRQEHEVTVFEANSYVGGHTNTVDVFDGGKKFAIDTGFIVFNDRTYPNFIELLDEIGQDWQDSEMSFSVRSDKIEYNGSSLDALFAQRSNLFRPGFYKMVRDILRFNKEAELNVDSVPDVTLAEYFADRNYGKAFLQQYLVPMAAAIWSAEPSRVLEMPTEFLFRFFRNHGLLQLNDRPTWRVIKGGSREYVRKLVAGHRDQIRLNTPVYEVRRRSPGVKIRSAGSDLETFDAVFFACHSDQALAMLPQPTTVESDVLGAIRYQPNEAILHTDERLMPQRRKVWAAWNYHVPSDAQRHVAVTYNMNILQGLRAANQYCVTLNNASEIRTDRIIKRLRYEHPMITRDAVRAQARQREINQDRFFFCGAYWRNGFHEDGVVSALQAVQHFEEWLNNEKLHLRRAS